MVDKTLWEKWDDVHGTDAQKKSFAKALSAELTPISIDNGGVGSFSGKHGYYTTTLEQCSCGDFTRRHLPCKHMYRLAIELGCIEGEAESNKLKVKRPKPDGLPLDKAVDVLESLDEDALKILHNYLYSSFYENQQEIVGVKVSDAYMSLVSAGVLVLCDEPIAILEALGRNEIRDRIIAAGTTSFNKNMKREILIKWALNNVPNVMELFSDCMAVKLADEYIKVSRSLYTYLNRRIRTEQYYDPDKHEMVEYPMGAKPYTIISADGSMVSGFRFPEDEITALLNKYGKNRCNK